MKLYGELAGWWPLLSPPEDYEEEAGVYTNALQAAGTGPAETALELGAGGGNNASYMKRHFAMTLTDVSDGMLAHSRILNPECVHVAGDMRTLRLGRRFDRVFVHDAICYMTSLTDLRQALGTAFEHLRPGGGLLIAPDYLRETFQPGTEHGGEDGEDRSLRYLEWVWDPNPEDSTYVADYVYVLREGAGMPAIEHDRHEEGLFSQAEWLATLTDAGFRAEIRFQEACGLRLPLITGMRES
ncbi:MAG: class I SAM-dependent methyltransferase [Acidobacteria bacterium]|nr:class I SAM-dependent methyltransferase [Acidobacteriota bacterium]